MRALRTLDRRFRRLRPAWVLLVSLLGVGLMGGIDYATGYEISMSLFYVAPVALASWYGGRRPGISIALLSCITWYVADRTAGNPYSHPAIPVWNSLVRLGFFLLSAGLLSALRDALGKERRRARTDSLTGLRSRLGFEERLEHDMALAQRLERAVTVAYLDLDGFKSVNDAHGHAAGDAVLRTTAGVLAGLIRRVDTAARLGGDEFALILPDTGEEGALELMARIGGELEAALAAAPSPVTCSIGVVTYLEAPESVAAVVAEADRLMYEVKRTGKGAVAHRVSPPRAGGTTVAG